MTATKIFVILPCEGTLQKFTEHIHLYLKLMKNTMHCIFAEVDLTGINATEKQ